MKKLPFYIVDVFAEEKYAGNQLAVFREAGALGGETMQRIARETNFSETTFILGDEPRDGVSTCASSLPGRRSRSPATRPWERRTSSAARS